MFLQTTRFGQVPFQTDEVLLFRSGPGPFSDQKHWVMLADANDGLYWLQAVSRSDASLAVVDAQLVEQKSVRVARSVLGSISMSYQHDLLVLYLAERSGEVMTLNRQMPIVINATLRVGRQIETHSDQALQVAPSKQAAIVRKSA